MDISQVLLYQSCPTGQYGPRGTFVQSVLENYIVMVNVNVKRKKLSKTK